MLQICNYNFILWQKLSSKNSRVGREPLYTITKLLTFWQPPVVQWCTWAGSRGSRQSVNHGERTSVSQEPHSAPPTLIHLQSCCSSPRWRADLRDLKNKPNHIRRHASTIESLELQGGTVSTKHIKYVTWPGRQKNSVEVTDQTMMHYMLITLLEC